MSHARRDEAEIERMRSAILEKAHDYAMAKLFGLMWEPGRGGVEGGWANIPREMKEAHATTLLAALGQTAEWMLKIMALPTGPEPTLEQMAKTMERRATALRTEAEALELRARALREAARTTR